MTSNGPKSKPLCTCTRVSNLHTCTAGTSCRLGLTHRLSSTRPTLTAATWLMVMIVAKGGGGEKREKGRRERRGEERGEKRDEKQCREELKEGNMERYDQRCLGDKI